MKYDFIEVGTSDFDTLIQKVPHMRGLSIEPIKHYLDLLPNSPTVTKVHAAISNMNGTIKIYSIHPNIIKQYNLPDWVRGCNKVGEYHPTVKKLLEDRGIPLDIITDDTVECIDYATLISRYNITGCEYLKVDTEGHDHIIINSIFDICELHPEQFPDYISFESNVLIPAEDINKIIKRSEQYNYMVVSSGHDTLLERIH